MRPYNAGGFLHARPIKSARSLNGVPSWIRLGPPPARGMVGAMLRTVEDRHLVSGPDPGEQPDGDGLVEIYALAPGTASDVVTRCRQVVKAIIDNGDPWPNLDEWKKKLPDWFASACAPEQTREEAERWLVWWRSLPPAEKAAAEDERGWSLSDWLYWLEPEQRDWFWWEGRAVSNDRAIIAVEVMDFNAPLGSLKWLLRTAGAREVRDSR